MGFGVLSTWMCLANSGLIWLSDVDTDGASISNLYLFTTTTTAVVLVLIPIARTWLHRVLHSRSTMLFFGVMALFGALLVVLAGPYYCANRILSRIGYVMMGIANAVLIMRLGQLYGSLRPQSQLAYLLLSELLCGLLYFFVLGNPLFYPIAGGPSFGGIAAFMVLPLLAAYLITLGPIQQDGDPEDRHGGGSPVAGSSLMPRVLFIKFFIAITVFAFSNALTRGFFISLSAPSSIASNSSMAMLFQVLLAGSILLLAIYLFSHIALGKVYLFLMVALAIILGLTPFLQIANDAITVAVTVTARIFGNVIWLLLGSIVFRNKLPAITVFGFGYGLFNAGSAAGCYVGVHAVPNSTGSGMEPAIYLGLAFLLFVCTTLIFSEKDFDKLFSDSNDLKLGKETPATDIEVWPSKAKDGYIDTRPWMSACKAVGMAANLSSREQEILELLARGRTPEGIAKHLFLSKNTVRSHTHAIYKKLDVHSRQELVALIEVERDNRIEPHRGQ